MRFKITHNTIYHYGTPASESFAEARMCPQPFKNQKLLKHTLTTTPKSHVEHYKDYFGNRVKFFNISTRHNKLKVTSKLEVNTSPAPDHSKILATPLHKALDSYKQRNLQLYDFLQPTSMIPINVNFPASIKNIHHPQAPLKNILLNLNQWIFTNLRYTPGYTDVSTPLQTVIQTHRGVCQDFAHLMLSVLRSWHIPARYISGYIEAFDPQHQDSPELIGAAATHAWVQALLPNGHWIGLDPTNNQIAGERHINIALGRDYSDITPLRGSYKGGLKHSLHVAVTVKRLSNNNKSK